MFYIGRDPHDISRPDLLDRTAPALHPSDARCHDQGLPQRVSVPRGASTGLKRHVSAGHPRRIVRLEKRIDARRTGEVFGRPKSRGLRANSLDVKIEFLSLR